MRWKMSASRIILASLPSVGQKLSKLVEIWRSSVKNNFAHFLRHGVLSKTLMRTGINYCIRKERSSFTDTARETAGPRGVATSNQTGWTVQVGDSEAWSTYCAGEENAALNEIFHCLTTCVEFIGQHRATITDSWAYDNEWARSFVKTDNTDVKLQT